MLSVIGHRLHMGEFVCLHLWSLSFVGRMSLIWWKMCCFIRGLHFKDFRFIQDSFVMFGFFMRALGVSVSGSSSK